MWEKVMLSCSVIKIDRALLNRLKFWAIKDPFLSIRWWFITWCIAGLVFSKVGISYAMIAKRYLFLAAIAVAACWAVPSSYRKEQIDPQLARVLLSNDFESGTADPWYDSSPSTAHWVVEDFTSPAEADYPPPTLTTGTKYLRATRNAQLSSGLLILRTLTFTAFPGDQVSFRFWIRSKYTGGNTLDVLYLFNLYYVMLHELWRILSRSSYWSIVPMWSRR